MCGSGYRIVGTRIKRGTSDGKARREGMAEVWPACHPRRFLTNLPEYLRSSFRTGTYADYRHSTIGFRLAQDIRITAARSNVPNVPNVLEFKSALRAVQSSKRINRNPNFREQTWSST